MTTKTIPQTAEQLIQEAWCQVQSNVIAFRSLSQDIEYYVKEMCMFDDELEAIGSHQLFMYRDLLMNQTTQAIDTDTRVKSMTLSFPFYSKIMIIYYHNHREYERLLNKMVQLVNESNKLLKENFSQASFCLLKKKHGNYVIPNVMYREKKAKTQTVPKFKPPEFPIKKEAEEFDERTPREEEDFDFTCIHEY